MSIVSAPMGSVTQTFDQPLPGALSPRNASYTLDVRLDRSAHTLTGRGTLRWRNTSRNAATELQFHLYWNAWKDANSTWMRERALTGNRAPTRNDAWGSIDVTKIATGGTPLTPRFVAPDDENPRDRTVMSVALPAPVEPNAAIEIELEWRAKVPRPFARTGYVDDFYYIGQWFPKVGVLEDSGWNTHQFHSVTEFYADFGEYDVRMTVPAGWLLGASGRETSKTDNGDGTATHRYQGADIHDFAWTTSPDYVEARQTFQHPTLPKVDMRLLILKEHLGQEQRHFDATAAALKYYGEWFGAYPYGHITVVDPAFQSGSSGMEYPTIFTAGTRWIPSKYVATPEEVTIHEAGHQWWYGMVASNEFEHAWMDEGINQYSDARVLEETGTPDFLSRRFFGGFVPWAFRDIPLTRANEGNGWSRYRTGAKSDVPATPAFRYWPGPSTGIIYFKPSLWLHTLERYLGWPTLQRILQTYFERWRFRHPQPADFFHVVNEVSGQDMTWFFNEVYRGSNAFDYAVQELASASEGGRYRTTVVAQRLGEAIFPVDVVTTFRDGMQKTEKWNGQARRQIYVYDTEVRAVSTEIDPKRVLLLDVSYANNSRTLDPRADDAGVKWALKWMVWLEDLMLTYGFFV